MQTQGPLQDIRQTITLNAPIEKVWKAVSTAEGIAAWWMPSTFEPVVGHEFILHAGQFGDSLVKLQRLMSRTVSVLIGGRIGILPLN